MPPIDGHGLNNGIGLPGKSLDLVEPYYVKYIKLVNDTFVLEKQNVTNL